MSEFNRSYEILNYNQNKRFYEYPKIPSSGRDDEVELFVIIGKALIEKVSGDPNGIARAILAEELCQDRGHPEEEPPEES